MNVPLTRNQLRRQKDTFILIENDWELLRSNEKWSSVLFFPPTLLKPRVVNDKLTLSVSITHPHTHSHKHSHRHSHTHSHRHSHTHSHTCAQVGEHIHRQAHAYIHIQTQTQSCNILFSLSLSHSKCLIQFLSRVTESLHTHIQTHTHKHTHTRTFFTYSLSPIQ